MKIKEIKKALIEQKNMNLSGNLYHKTQIEFAYNTNHMEGSTITLDETASIYDTGTILTSSYKRMFFSKFREQREDELKHRLIEVDPEVERFILQDTNLVSIKGTPEYNSSIVPANAKSWAGMKEWQGIPLVFDAK